jgi:hypothetical protein
MDIDVVGRLKNTKLPLSKPLLPLFEAVVNSIHAIEDAGVQDGQITITVQRGGQQALPLDADSGIYAPVTGFIVEDNGIGFTEQNYREFTRADTTWKAARGGRGVGRFIWLKAFSRVRIDSIFRENGQTHRRRFLFVRSPEGIKEPQLESAGGQIPRTTVELLNFEEPHAGLCPRQPRSIAARIVDYAIDYFVLGEVPKMILVDQAADAPIDLAEMYAELVTDSRIEEYQIGQHLFRVRHFLLRALPGLEHRLIFCAERHPVREEKLQRRIPNLTGRLSPEEGEEELVYAGYVSSGFLDDHVNQERTSFSTVDDDIRFPGELSWSEIEEPTLGEAAKFLEPFTEPIREAKHEDIKNFVAREAPEFRYLLKHHPAALDDVPPNLPPAKLGAELYRLQKDFEVKLRHEAVEVLQHEDSDTKDLDQGELEAHRARFARFLEEWNDLGKAELARYIVHRKATLSVLRVRLKRRSDARYPLETAIHSVIFPLRSTSDDIAFDKQNLWVLDEKLSYHWYLASDLRLDQVEALHGVTSGDRPDLLIFDNPVAVVDQGPPYTSIVIFEFKRPQRDDYTATKNPIEQTLRYAGRIRAGEILDKDGRPVRVNLNTPFFCYIVCDITKTLQEQAELANLQETPDREGYFGYNRNRQAYIEIVSFDKLIRDAELRNRILFDKLGINDYQSAPGSGSCPLGS